VCPPEICVLELRCGVSHYTTFILSFLSRTNISSGSGQVVLFFLLVLLTYDIIFTVAYFALSQSGTPPTFHSQFLLHFNMNTRPHKQSMSELKLRRLTEHNQRLREDLARPRMRVSEASARYVLPCLLPTKPGTHGSHLRSLSYSLIRYCKTTKDHLVRSYFGSLHVGSLYL
jgi:guanine nucleotide-binding protein subunit gamma